MHFDHRYSSLVTPFDENSEVAKDAGDFDASYSALYRVLSTYEVHGLGPVQTWVDLGARQLKPTSDLKSFLNPIEPLLLVASLVVEITADLFGLLTIPPSSDEDKRDQYVEWMAATLDLRVATRAVAANEPAIWLDHIAESETC